MTDSGRDSDLGRMATAIVDVLEVGSRKVDRLAGSFCAEFDVDLSAIVDAQNDFAERSRDLSRATVAAALAAAAPDDAALLAAFARHGGTVIDMVEDIYVLLAKHSATVGDTAETFVVRPDAGVELTISPAFIEELRRFLERLQPVELGRVDTELLLRLVWYDDGESYGRWPPQNDDGRPLLHHIMALRSIRSALAERVSGTPSYRHAVASADAALAVAGRLIDRLEQVLVGAGAFLLEHGDEPVSDDREEIEREVLRRHGLFGARVNPNFFNELDNGVFMAMQVASGDPLQPVAPTPVRRTDLVDSWGAGLSHLGSYLAIVRSELTLVDERYMDRRGDPVPIRELVDAETAEPAMDWLDGLAIDMTQAIGWIDTTLWTPTGTTDVSVTVEEVEQMLRLPIWRRRDVLFELWVLCHTISTAGDAGWEAVLGGVSGDVWTLPERSVDTPVAVLTAADESLHVWREPLRSVTPDVTISTSDAVGRDLVVVEAKDRYRMKSGIGAQQDRPAHRETALGVANRYATELKSSLTWVCNHSSYSGGLVRSDRNEGSRWHQIHLAEEMSPRHVPSAFAATIHAALVPRASDVVESRAAIFVVDTTSSMDQPLIRLLAFLRDLPAQTCSSYGAILFGDHDDAYVVRPVAVHREPGELAAAIAREPTTSGGDEPEALEDAMNHAAWLAEGSRQVFIVVTDAQPHTAAECPDDLDFGEEVGKVLASGASILVVTDWYEHAPEEWKQFEASGSCVLTSLADLPKHLAGR